MFVCEDTSSFFLHSFFRPINFLSPILLPACLPYFFPLLLLFYSSIFVCSRRLIMMMNFKKKRKRKKRFLANIWPRWIKNNRNWIREFLHVDFLFFSFFFSWVCVNKSSKLIDPGWYVQNQEQDDEVDRISRWGKVNKLLCICLNFIYFILFSSNNYIQKKVNDFKQVWFLTGCYLLCVFFFSFLLFAYKFFVVHLNTHLPSLPCFLFEMSLGIYVYATDAAPPPPAIKNERIYKTEKILFIVIMK